MGEARLILWGIAEGTKNVLLTEAEREKTQHCSLQKSEKLPGGKEWFWVHPHERPDRGRSLFNYYQKGILTARADQRWSGLRRLWPCIGGDFQAMFVIAEQLDNLSSQPQDSVILPELFPRQLMPLSVPWVLWPTGSLQNHIGRLRTGVWLRCTSELTGNLRFL